VTRASLRWLAIFAVLIMLGMVFGEAFARGRGGGRRGGGGGMRGGGGYSRSGPASYGTMGSGRSTRSRSSGAWGSGSTNPSGRSRSDTGAGSRETRRGGTIEGERTGGSYEGTYTGRGGETVDYSGSVKRTDDGLERSGTWESSTGATGSVDSKVGVEDGRVTGAERSRQGESASGETIERTVSSERHGDVVEREGEIKTSTGIDAETESRIKKTDDGFAAEVYAEGKDGEAYGQIVRDGDDVYARGVSRDGDDVSWGRMHCDSGRCTGGRVHADLDDYDGYPYYYYPYYYAYYACPPGHSTVVIGSYGTSVYSCSTTVIISTTVTYSSSNSFSETTSSGGGYSGGQAKVQAQAQVKSSPVVMYEISPKLVVYATSYDPEGLYAEKSGEYYYWVPGAAKGTPEVKKWIKQAQQRDEPTANSTVITYTINDRLVYLTNERPMQNIHAEQADGLYAWLSGVAAPNEKQQDALTTALTTHREGGEKALDAKVRELQEGREPPAPGKGAGQG
jgi:hypothetical protein